MTRRWKLLTVVVVAIAAIGAVWTTFTSASQEPTYQGRKLSEWLVDAATNHFGKNISEVRASVPVHAVLAMGTNAHPWLVKWINYDPTFIPFRIQMRIPAARKIAERAILRKMAAQDMLQYLGTNAAPAIPMITHKLQTLPPGNPAQSLAIALFRIGPPGVDAITQSVTDTNIPPTTRVFLITLLELRYKSLTERNVSKIQAALTNCLADPLSEIRNAAQVCLQARPHTPQPAPHGHVSYE